MLTKDCKEGVIKQFARSEGDTGSCEVQIALLTKRIKQIAEHLKSFPKDFHSRRGLIKILARRKIYGSYLKRQDVNRYDSVMAKIKEL
jgi:small subunit ribosomal protein S15